MPTKHTSKTDSVISYHPIKNSDNLSRMITYLDVIVGVPVRVIDDDGVCRCKIDSQTTSSGREEEGKLGSTRRC